MGRTSTQLGAGKKKKKKERLSQGRMARHAVSSWLHDWICCSLPLVNNITGEKHVGVMIMHIPPDRRLSHTHSLQQLLRLCKIGYSRRGPQCSMAQMIFTAANQLNSFCEAWERRNACQQPRLDSAATNDLN